MRREHYPGDRRDWLATLTDDGLTTLRTAAPAPIDSVRAHLFDQLDLLTPQQVEQLGEVSEVILTTPHRCRGHTSCSVQWPTAMPTATEWSSGKAMAACQ
ncbi:hypothetical protein SALCHL_000097 [Streptomyces albus subsp. chlorinus]|uniref:hypothetical protein n=1 Tax=Streptomyces albus TaxID=1888 RepID=UPI00191DEEB0|nr:hypothetical protein [Streptomyces albus]